MDASSNDATTTTTGFVTTSMENMTIMKKEPTTTTTTTEPKKTNKTKTKKGTGEDPRRRIDNKINNNAELASSVGVSEEPQPTTPPAPVQRIASVNDDGPKRNDDGIGADGNGDGDVGVRASVQARVEAYEGMVHESEKNAAVSSPRTPINQKPARRPTAEALEQGTREAFVAFSKFGRGGGAQTHDAQTFDKKEKIMDSTRFAKLCRETLFPRNAEARRKCEIAFTKHSGLVQRKIDYVTFKRILRDEVVELAGMKSVEDVQARLVDAKPSVGGATPPSVQRLHDDYTEQSRMEQQKSPSSRRLTPSSSITDTVALSDPASLPPVKGLRAAYERFTQFSPSCARLSTTRWLKLCEDCGLFTVVADFDAISAGIVFNAIEKARATKTLDFDSFRLALELSARRAGRPYVDFAARVASGVPLIRASVPSPTPVRLADDTQTFTSTARDVHRDKVLTPRALSIRKASAPPSA